METNYVLGVLGAAIILLAFIMNQLGRWRDTSLVYDAANLIGGVLLVIYAYNLRAYPFMILNSVWALISVRDVVVDLTRRGSHHGGFFRKWKR
ncbi:MAG: hypothetical protein A3F54_02840 [Candidatus Kerfeldbacteria bacterium RIFCSPHIGHO2_12_FULL_48_17]|uniref:CBU-0592-like domain-containing protein n=1 Tax=Candidatus Kerfeldbacteria bacterium RIFCSPHIGHO2_12_FULL_48_17 TaxID=1798542 RepID=A0A1G2B261_9BACT|nr:MAG: hypothetical protein A3F54_02840 [Candidatus Kerfeldbacteria bacterium RIFCSPHIGHO2_12_FULL_48_17]